MINMIQYLILQLKNKKYPIFYYQIQSLHLDNIGNGHKAVLKINGMEYFYYNVQYLVRVKEWINEHGIPAASEQYLYHESDYDKRFPNRCAMCDYWFRPWEDFYIIHTNIKNEKVKICSKECMEEYEEWEDNDFKPNVSDKVFIHEHDLVETKFHPYHFELKTQIENMIGDMDKLSRLYKVVSEFITSKPRKSRKKIRIIRKWLKKFEKDLDTI